MRRDSHFSVIDLPPQCVRVGAWVHRRKEAWVHRRTGVQVRRHRCTGVQTRVHGRIESLPPPAQPIQNVLSGRHRPSFGIWRPLFPWPAGEFRRFWWNLRLKSGAGCCTMGPQDSRPAVHGVPHPIQTMGCGRSAAAKMGLYGYAAVYCTRIRNEERGSKS